MTLTQYLEAFLEKFVRHSLREIRDEFTDLVQGSVSFAEYEAWFHELS